MLISKRGSEFANHDNNPQVFIGYSPGKKQNVLIVFDNKIADKIDNKELNQIVTELHKRQDAKRFFCFYFAVLVQSTIICYNRHYTLFYRKDSKQVESFNKYQ